MPAAQLSARYSIEITFRREYGRVLAALISSMGDFTLAEDALQDALVLALQQWADDGVPRNPGAWLTTIARGRAIDRLRRESTFDRRQEAILHAMTPDAEEPSDLDDPDSEANFPDERLKLMFTCCHPSLALDAQVALTLR